MKIKVFEEAEQDLIDGFRFYEAQKSGLGEYFLDSLFSFVSNVGLKFNPKPKTLTQYFYLFL